MSQITIDCHDPIALARWWAQALGWDLVDDPDEAGDDDGPVEIEIGPSDGSATNWLFVEVPEGKAVKNRVHPDVRPPDGSDQATELARLVALGATHVDVGQGDVPWHVLADPEGNEFCLLRSTPSQLADAPAAGS